MTKPRAPPGARQTSPEQALAFLAGGGEMARLIAAFDWGATPLGPLASWPPARRTTVGLILHSPIPIATLWGEDGIMVYNDAYSVVAGGRHPQVLGSKVREGWPEVADFCDHLMRAVLAGDTLAYQDQELILNRNGQPEQAWFDLGYSPIIGASGRPEGVMAIVVETTAKVRAEQRLRVTAAELARLNAELEQRVAERTAERDRIWRYSRNLLGVCDAEGILHAVNPAWTTILGYAPEDMVGRSAFDFVWPEDVAITQEKMKDAALHRDLMSFENRYRHKDGTPRWISWNTAAEGGLIYGYGRDITAEKMQAAALRQAEEQLRQAQKMEAVGQLTGGIAHDFNNLLAGISGSLELLRGRIAQGRYQDLDRYIAAALGAAARAASLTHRLLAFSRRQTLDPRPTDITRLIKDIADLIRRTVGPGIMVEVTGAPGTWLTLIDANQLESTLLNLCINARDAMPEGGRITIQTTNTELDEQAARELGLAAGHYLSLRVIDTGTGMTPEVIARAFDPFFTTKPLGQGTGLGLSMVYGFVRQSGGQVRISSEPGQGTTITLYLPRYRGPGPAGATETDIPRAALPRTGRGETVLVVDDEATLRMLAMEVLEELGYAALEAPDGAAGLEVLRAPHRIDLLVTDIGLPGMNGRQLADAARLIRPGLKVLFITGYAENAAMGQLEPGMQVLTKPFPLETLASLIKAMIADAPEPAGEREG